MQTKEGQTKEGQTKEGQTKEGQTKILIEIVGLSDLWLAWVKPNRMMARAVAEVLSALLTPETVGGLVKEVLGALAGQSEDPNRAVKGLADRVLKLMSTGEHDRIKQLCQMVLKTG